MVDRRLSKKVVIIFLGGGAEAEAAGVFMHLSGITHFFTGVCRNLREKRDVFGEKLAEVKGI